MRHLLFTVLLFLCLIWFYCLNPHQVERFSTLTTTSNYGKSLYEGLTYQKLPSESIDTSILKNVQYQFTTELNGTVPTSYILRKIGTGTSTIPPLYMTFGMSNGSPIYTSDKSKAVITHKCSNPLAKDIYVIYSGGQYYSFGYNPSNRQLQFVKITRPNDIKLVTVNGLYSEIQSIRL